MLGCTLLQPDGEGGVQKGSEDPGRALGSTHEKGFGKPHSKHLSPCRADTTLADTHGDLQGRGLSCNLGRARV